MEVNEIFIISKEQSFSYIFDSTFFSGIFSQMKVKFVTNYRKFITSFGYRSNPKLLNLVKSIWNGCGYVRIQTDLVPLNAEKDRTLRQIIDKCLNGKIYRRKCYDACTVIGKEKYFSFSNSKEDNIVNYHKGESLCLANDSNLIYENNGYLEILGQKTFKISPWFPLNKECPKCTRRNEKREDKSNIKYSTKLANITILLYQGDITEIKADAIVNATNPSLFGFGGVDGAIHDVAGSALDEECMKLNKIGGCPPGEARITSGGNLPAKYVIHTVGPRWIGGKNREPEMLSKCYRNCIELAKKHEISSLIFSSISTGIYGYPIYKAAEIGKKSITKVLKDPGPLKQVGWCLYDANTFKIYRDIWS